MESFPERVWTELLYSKLVEQADTQGRQSERWGYCERKILGRCHPGINGPKTKGVRTNSSMSLLLGHCVFQCLTCTELRDFLGWY